MFISRRSCSKEEETSTFGFVTSEIVPISTDVEEGEDPGGELSDCYFCVSVASYVHRFSGQSHGSRRRWLSCRVVESKLVPLTSLDSYEGYVDLTQGM